MINIFFWENTIFPSLGAYSNTQLQYSYHMIKSCNNYIIIYIYIYIYIISEVFFVVDVIIVFFIPKARQSIRKSWLRGYTSILWYLINVVLLWTFVLFSWHCVIITFLSQEIETQLSLPCQTMMNSMCVCIYIYIYIYTYYNGRCSCYKYDKMRCSLYAY